MVTPSPTIVPAPHVPAQAPYIPGVTPVMPMPTVGPQQFIPKKVTGVIPKNCQQAIGIMLFLWCCFCRLIRAAEATGLGFVCFAGFNPRVLANRVYIGIFFLLYKLSDFTPPPSPSPQCTIVAWCPTTPEQRWRRLRTKRKTKTMPRRCARPRLAKVGDAQCTSLFLLHILNILKV